MLDRTLRRLGLATVASVSMLSATCAAWADEPASVPAPIPVPHLQPGQHFVIDPITDGLLTAGGAVSAGLLSLVLQTGEIQATYPGPVSNLLSIDRGAVSQTPDPNAALYSDIGLYSAVAFAVVDPVLSGLRDGWDATIVDAVLYAESVALTEMLTDITKIAVRRPRPIDYVKCPPTMGTMVGTVTPECTGTNYDLSFFSGHASTVGAIGATATYLAFVRSPGTARPWITLAASVLWTTFVSIERVRGGDHFPTDVIAGSLAGATVGLLVPHMHRLREGAPAVIVGAAPTSDGGTVTLTGIF
jgi:undecaprenyl-diphosphatase